MADGFIVRKGGAVTEQALAPTITEVSVDLTEIVFTITNNDTESAVILWEIGDITPDANSVELAAAATTSNITVTGLTAGTTYTVSATASVTNKVLSNVTSLGIETDEFSPADLSPQLWLDASDSSTITESSGSVSQWNNKGSLGNFTQATSANQPTTGVTTLNGLNVIDFDSDFLTAANQNEWKFMHDGTVHEVFAVIKFGTTANPNVPYRLMGTANASTSVGFFIGYDDRSSESNNDRILHAGYLGSSGQTTIVNFTANDFYAPNTFAILSVFSDAGNATDANRSEIRKNGGTAEKNNASASSPSSSNPSNALQIASDGTGAAALVGSIAEVIVISGANVTSTNRTDIIDYLSDKWGITI